MSGEPEMLRPFAAERLGAGGTAITVTAAPGECAAIAARLLIPAVGALTCAWSLRPGQKGLIHAEGVLQAQVTQVCVVSQEPFDSTITESFEVYFVLDGQQSDEDDLEAPDELIYDGVTLDLGEATVEQLALALDPYPRSPAAELSIPAEQPGGSAFAALAKLRDLD